MQRHTWRLVAQDAVIIRHCQGCGRKTGFRNSGKIRRNANGKQVHQYEIYKCERDHTWNRSVSVTEAEAEQTAARPNPEGTRLSRIQLDNTAIGIEIRLEHVAGKWRLDRVLTQQIDGLARSAVVDLIEHGAIVVNGRRVRGKHALRTGDVITIHFAGYPSSA